MTYFFGDSFDFYANIPDAYMGVPPTGTYWDSGSVALGYYGVGRFANSLAYQPGSNQYLNKVSNINDNIHHINLAIIDPATTLTGTTICPFVTFYDGATAQCSVGFRTDGSIILTSGAIGGTILATYNGAITALNTWYAFEIEVVISNTAGSITVRKSGDITNTFQATSLNTRNSANNYANNIRLGGNNTVGHLIDDFLWRSDSVSVAWLGDVRSYVRRPVSDQGVQFTPSTPTVPHGYPPVNTGTPTGTNSSANQALYMPFIALCNGTLGTVTVRLLAGYTGNFKLALYSDNAGTPGTVLGTATALVNPVTGNNTFTFTTPPSITQGTKYWIGYVMDTSVSSSIPAMGYNSYPYFPYNAAWYQNSVTFASWPTNNPGITGQANYCVYTANITPTSPINAPMVAEMQEDLAASYVQSSTVGNADFYGLGSISGTPTTIAGVTTRVCIQKSDVGSRSAALNLKSGATTSSGVSTAINNVWQWQFRNDTIDPATGTIWTTAGVNNLQVGVSVTV